MCSSPWPPGVGGGGCGTPYCCGSTTRGVRAMSEPLPVCHLNGALLPLREARISPLDRSFLFGDGIYEVIAARGGRPKRLAANLARLSRSLAAVRIPNPHDPEHWAALI